VSFYTVKNFGPVSWEKSGNLVEWKVTNKTQKPFSFEKYSSKKYLEILSTNMQVHNLNLNNSRNVKTTYGTLNFNLFLRPLGNFGSGRTRINLLRNTDLIVVFFSMYEMKSHR